MRIVQLTPGTGNFYCGHCLRDNALALALRARGHDVSMIPLYLPAVTDDTSASDGMPIFFGGINVYLEEKFPMLRRAPAWLTGILDSPALLRASARLANMTSAKDLGELTVSMLRGEQGHQSRELQKLIRWIKAHGRPDVVCLSTALLAGLARTIKRELGAPVVSTLQGEDSFLDGLSEPYRHRAWSLLRQRSADVDLFVAVSNYYGGVMRDRLALSPDRVAVVHNGITLDGFEPAPAAPASPVLGYLARMCKAKGLGTLVDAFIELKRRDRVKGLQLRVAGARTPADGSFVAEMQRQLAHAGVAGAVEWLPNIDRKQKLDFLRSLSVLSVPAIYGEAFGLYVIEALACAVPVVQPRHGAFAELIEATGGGILCKPGDVGALADAIESLMLQPDRARELGRQGRRVVLEKFGVERMAENVEDVLNRVTKGATAAHGVRV
jgi:glycosyltransferase involved in cell wall biosynthesis